MTSVALLLVSYWQGSESAHLIISDQSYLRYRHGHLISSISNIPDPATPPQPHNYTTTTDQESQNTSAYTQRQSIHCVSSLEFNRTASLAWPPKLQTDSRR